ncbi:MAG: NAD(+) diphosphatase [Treponema sp.]|nr:NAD(+) diphosphatase [Treponema sp.]
MSSNIFPGVYLFQGNTLVAPGDIPDSMIHEGILNMPASIASSITMLDIPSINGPRNEATGVIQSADLPPDLPLPAGWRGIPVRQALTLMTNDVTVDGTGPVGRLFRAYHILQWRRESVFCGSCGSRNEDTLGSLARRCPVCGRQEFPRISPAIIVIIINDEDKALLAHNKQFAPGLYSLIAGFTEAGENLEATVAREVREEVGLAVQDICYVASQPWPFPNSLMLGFTARYAAGTIRVDGKEIEDARWFSRDMLPALPGNGSVSRYLINRWLEGKLGPRAAQ